MIWFFLVPLLIAWLLYVLTRLGTLYLERAYPPLGTKVMNPDDGASVHLVERGKPYPDRPSLLFVHGASSNHREFIIALGEHLQTRFGPDQHCLFVDRPGQGSSVRWPGDHSPRVQADRLMAVARAMGAERCLVVGHSWGGAVVAQMAVHHKDRVAGAIFLAPATHPWPGDRFEGVDWHYAVADMPIVGWLFTRLVTLPVAWTQIEAGVENVFAPEPPRSGYAKALVARLVLRPRCFRANAQDVYRLRPFVIAEASSYQTISCPVRVITGDQDGVVWPHIHSDGLERDIQGANKTVIEGGGHMPHQTHPDLVLDAIDELLEKEQAPAEQALAENPS